MTDADMIAYCTAQLATITRQERDALDLLATLRGGRQAYEDLIAECTTRQLTHAPLDTQEDEAA